MTVWRFRRLTGALLDRLTHHVHILELNGDSYRLAQALVHNSRSRSILALHPEIRGPA